MRETKTEIAQSPDTRNECILLDQRTEPMTPGTDGIPQGAERVTSTQVSSTRASPARPTAVGGGTLMFA